MTTSGGHDTCLCPVASPVRPKARVDRTEENRPALNIRDFDSELLRQRRIAIVTPPQLVGQLVDDEPSVVSLALWSMAARKKRPPMSPPDVVAAIGRQQGFGALEDSLHVLVD